MKHYILSCQEARQIFEPKTLKTQAKDALEAVKVALTSLIGQTLAVLQIDPQTFVAYSPEEFTDHDICLAYKNQCLHDDTFVLKILK